MIRFSILFVLAVTFFGQISAFAYFKLGEDATIPLPVSANYRRNITNRDTFQYEQHIFRVCNGKNAKKCGFWENIETKKKIPSGKTQYNKNKKALIIKGLLANDFGTYMTGNQKKVFRVQKAVN
ncbi:unnamed protein product [Caenorhabditis brenneri]